MKKSEVDQFQEFGNQLSALFLLICHELKIDVLVETLNDLLRKSKR